MIIKCKMCGGDIQFNPGDTCGQCDHCGCTTTLPKLPDEQRTNLFNRANHFRRQCEFDKAMAAYEHILEVDDTDAEAHWGIVLSKFGIEYVEDPVTHERIPTCHRAQVISILSDEDYQNAIKYAPDTQSRDIYEQEAKRIAEIQKGILAISSQEKPYDVFICYKETDDNGSRSKDSTLAQEIYYQLTNEGYKVFFSRITLEDKLGQEYEPYIFAALNSAKVMLVVGTKPENFSAVWVKNEWSRFLAIMKNDRKRVLIPCYRDMDPYDLPEELSSLQSQDMSKIGFMQDLIHGVKKVLGSDKQSTPNVAVQSVGPGIASLHKRAVLFLEDSDWDSATEYFDRILDIDPEYAPAYIGKVQVKNRVRREADLARCRNPISTDADYQKALRFADEKHKAIYEGYNREILDRIALERKEAAYREAVALESRAAVEADFLAAAKKFDAAEDIRDAKQRAANCRAKAATAKAEAEKAAAVYKAQMERERKEREKQEEERRLAEEKRQAEEMEQQRKEEALRQDKRKHATKIGAFMAVIVLIIVGGYYLFENVIHPKFKYNQAQSLLNDGKYDEAYSAFETMGDYGDSSNKLLEINYRKAESYLAKKDFANARKYFVLAGSYSDANQQIQNIDQYITAQTDYESGNLISAGEKYKNLGNFSDAAAQFESISSTLYSQTKTALENKNFQDAFDLLTILGDYSDCTALMAGIDEKYNLALQHWKDGEKIQAEQELQSLIGWREASDKLSALRLEIADDAVVGKNYDQAITYYNKITNRSETIEAKQKTAVQGKNYTEGVARLSAGELDSALEKFTAAGEFEDAAIQAAQITAYQQAESYLSEGKYQEARAIYLQLGDYLQAAEKLEACNAGIYSEAATLKANGDYAKANEMFVLISGYSDSADIASQFKTDYQTATDLLEKGSYDEAYAAFAALKNYADSPEKAKESMYLKAESLKEAGAIDDAVAIYAELGDYKDSAEKNNICLYSKAEKQIADGQMEEAIVTFESISDYSDSSERAKVLRYDHAKALWNEGNLQAARKEYEALGNYSDSADLLVQVLTETADKAMDEKDYATALSAYQGLEQTDYIKEREYMLAQLCYDEGHFAEAVSAYENLGQYELSLSKLPVARYALADQLFNNGEYEKAAEQFALLGDMTDSATRANESNYQLASQRLTARNYDDAKDLFNSLADYKDAGTLAKECDYRKAADILAEGKNKEAEALFKSLGEYSDSKTKAEECIYNQAEILFTAEKYAEAKLLYDTITYSDSQTKSKQCVYNQAEALFAADKYADAKPLYDSIDYSDSLTKSKQCVYNQAEALFAAKKYNEASKMYDSVDYLDSKDKAKLSTYQEAETYYSGKKYAEAEVIFLSLKDYSDSADRAKDCHLQQGIVLMDAEDYRGALEFFETVEYENSADLAAKCHYELGHISHLAGKTDEAVAEYAYAVSLPEARSALLSAAKDYSVINEPEKAIQTLWLIRYQEEAQNELVNVATTTTQNGKTDLAILSYAAFEEYPEFDFVELYQNTSYDGIKRLVNNCSLLSDNLGFKEYALYHFADIARDYGFYNVSIQVYSDLGEYSDSTTQIAATRYAEGEAKREASDWDGAIKAFMEAGTYSDAVIQISETRYQEASAKEKDGDQQGAYDIFIGLGEYKDSFKRANKPYYDLGMAKQSVGEWDEAIAAFKHAGTYSDAVIQISETRYQEASAKEKDGDQQGAYDIFISLGEYNDSFERANKPYYDMGIEKRNIGEWDAAVAAFEHAGDFSDAKEQILKTRYAEGEAKRSAEDWDGAVAVFRALGDYSDAKEQVLKTRYAEGEAKRTAEDWDGAAAVFMALGDYNDAKEQVKLTRYTEGETKREDKDWEGAIKAYKAAGNYADSREKMKDSTYDMASELFANKEYDSALKLFIDLDEYKDSNTKVKECQYYIALKNLYNKQYDKAIEILSILGDYRDSVIQLNESYYNKALEAYAAKQYREAYKLFEKIKNYKDANEMMERTLLLSVKVGDILLFGEYEQDNNLSNGKEKIEWVVLEVKDNKALLLSDKGLDAIQYNEKHVNPSSKPKVTWENCTLRLWLNNEFIQSFNSEEQSAIVITLIDNSPKEGSKYDVPNTEDKVFLLSTHEVNDLYSSNISIQCSPTAYARAHGGEDVWWLRNLGYNSQRAAIASNSKYVESRSRSFIDEAVCVRPALWIDLSFSEYIKVKE